MPTTTELASKILKKIGVLDPDESPTAQEGQDTIDIMQSVYDGLKELGNINWPLTSIPSMFEDPFIVFVGWHVQVNFGIETISGARAQKAQRDIDALSSNKEDPRLNPVVDF